MNIFELFYRNQDPHSGGGWWLHADHEHADPRLVGIRRLRFQKYHPVTSPPTNQKGRELIIYPETFSPNIVLKNPCLKAIQVVQTIWAWTACSPCLVPAANAVLPFTQLALLFIGEQTQIWFGNTTTQQRQDLQSRDDTFLFVFLPHHVACGILVLWPEFEPEPSAVRIWVLITGPPGMIILRKDNWKLNI